MRSAMVTDRSPSTDRLYRKVSSDALAPLVEAYAGRSATGKLATFPVFPTGRAELIFHFADPFRTGSEASLQPLARAALLGPRSSSYWHAAGPTIDWFLIQLTPIGMRQFLGARFDRCWDRAVLLSNLPHALPIDLFERLCSAGSFAARAALVDTLLLTIPPVDDGGDVAVSEAGRLARRSEINTIAGLADFVGVGERRLRQRFRAEYGVAPKAFLQLVRLGRQLQSLHPDHAADPDTALAEYADESHAIRAFRRHTGLTPSAYREIKHSGDPLVFTGRSETIRRSGAAVQGVLEGKAE